MNEPQPSPFSLQQLDNCDANQLNDPVIVLNFHYPMLDTINLLQYVLFLALGGKEKKKITQHCLTKCTQATSAIRNVRRPPPPPSPTPPSVFSPRLTLFALFYPFAWTSGNRKWH